jgi:hypothetical protein
MVALGRLCAAGDFWTEFVGECDEANCALALAIAITRIINAL